MPISARPIIAQQGLEFPKEIRNWFSTALFCMSLEEGQALVNSIDGVEAMWVSYDETKYYSNGFDQFIVK